MRFDICNGQGKITGNYVRDSVFGIKHPTKGDWADRFSSNIWKATPEWF